MAWTTGLPPSVQNATFALCNDSGCGNFTSIKETPYTPYVDRPETYIVPIVFLVILVVGVTGNGLLVLTILRHANMRNVPNTYVLSLALGDLLVIVTCVPFTSTIYTLESWPFGLLLCKVSECAKDISIGVSVFTLTALSADRFFAIVDPLRKLHATGRGRATRCTMITAGLIWLLAVGFAVPASFSYIKEIKINTDVSFEACYPFPDEFGKSYPKYVVASRFVIYYAIPLFVIGVFYLLMARHLVQSTRKIPGEMQGQGKQVQARRKVARMVLAFVAVFAICFFPQHVYMLWFYFYPNAKNEYNQFWHTFRILGFCLAFMNSCINPIALYCVSGTFRKYFNSYLLCRCLREKHRSRLSLESNRRGQSFSLSSRRQTSTKRLSCRTGVTHTTRWNAVGSGAGASGSGCEFHCRDPRQQQQQQHQQQQHQEQETTVSLYNNGLEQPPVKSFLSTNRYGTCPYSQAPNPV